MKRFWILILASFVLLTPTGCARFPRRQLEDIESYLESRPDSALTALDAMSRRKLYTPALRAHHALFHDGISARSDPVCASSQYVSSQV